ncbi:MAG: hypothetical protein GX589_10945 [Deltaproteobacteria bacterium]|nr:hypothetical protein [Deltaproteobacteria bacterium]
MNWDTKLLIATIDPNQSKTIKHFHVSTFNKFLSEITEQGYYSPLETLDHADALMHVLSDMNATIQNGHIKAEEVRCIFETLWHDTEQPQRSLPLST